MLNELHKEERQSIDRLMEQKLDEYIAPLKEEGNRRKRLNGTTSRENENTTLPMQAWLRVVIAVVQLRLSHM